MRYLVKWAHSLRRNIFLGLEERHAKVLSGPPGCGKTTTFKRFSAVASVLFPHIRVVYCNAESVHKPTHSFQLHGGVIAALHAMFDTRDARPGGSGLKSFLAALGENHMFLIVDNTDTLYLVNETKYRDYLREIKAMASTLSGRVFLVACCSCDALHELIKASPRDTLKKIYTLDGEDMNGSKICPVALKSSLPTDLEAVAPFFPHLWELPPDEAMGTTRLAAFMCGTSARALHEYSLLPPAMPVSPLAWLMSNERLSPVTRHEPGFPTFLLAIFDVLAAANSALITPLLDDAYNPIVSLVSSRPWEVSFEPLRSPQVYQVFRHVCGPEASPTMCTTYVQLLVYAGLVVLDRDATSYDLYPASLALLVQHIASRKPRVVAAQPLHTTDAPLPVPQVAQSRLQQGRP